MRSLRGQKKLSVAKPERGTRPRVYYRNLLLVTADFVGGDVFALSASGRLEHLEEALQPHRRVAAPVSAAMKHIEMLIGDGGEITLGAAGGAQCTATAADHHNCMAMLVRREGETLTALLRRLDKAIGTVLDGGDPIYEVNR